MHGLFYASLLTGALLLTGIREAVANCISVPTHERIFDLGDIIVTPESVGVRWVRAEAEWPRINISSSSTSPCSILFRPLKSTSLDIVRNVQIYPTNGDVGLSSNIGVVAYNTPSAVNLTVRPPRDTPTTINQVVNFGVDTSILIHYNNSEYVSSQPFFSGPFNVPFFQVESADGQYLYYRFILKGTARYIPVLLRNENTTVDLPPVSSSVFQGVGSVAGRTPIPLEIVSSNVNSQNFITFDAITVRNGNIIIPDSGAATGVGFQIVNAASGTPVQLGQPLSVPGNINGSFSNYSAQYIQVADRVDGGKVSAVVTMTLTYQ